MSVVWPRRAGPRCGCAALAGALGAVALLPGSFAPLAWVSVLPLFLALDGARAGTTIAVAVSYAVVLGLGSVLPTVAPAAPLYFPLHAARAVVYTVAGLVVLSAAHGLLLGTALLARPAIIGPWTVLWYGALWVCWEEIRTLAFPYYPAAALGISQHDGAAVLQVASLGGLAAVTFTIVSFNAGLAAGFQRGPSLRRRLAAAGVGVTVAAGAVAWGERRLAAPDLPSPPVAIRAIDIGAMTPSASTLDRYLAASREVGAAGETLLIWPESALATDVERDRGAWGALQSLLVEQGTPLLLGGPGSARSGGSSFLHFNAMHLLRPAGGMQSYRKRFLVPFAERWPAMLGDPPPGITHLDAGRELPVFRLPHTAFGVLICFEIADAAAARAIAGAGALFIVNATNDAWFVRGAPPIHFPLAAVRAVETGLPVVRVANVGRSAIIDRFGREVATARPSGSVTVLAGDVPAASPTLYSRVGDVFLGLCAIAVLAGLVRGAMGARTRSRRYPTSSSPYASRTSARPRRR